MNLSLSLVNEIIDGIFRGGALTSAGAAGSTAVVNKGVWTASTTYAVGDVVVPHPNMTGAGGKFLRCTSAGTSGTTNTLAVPNPGATLADNTVTWTAVSGVPSELMVYAALITINKGLRANNTAYSVGDCISLTPQGGANGDTNQHLYHCTTAGTTAASQPQYNGVDGEAITDGTAVFTEMSAVWKTGTGYPAGMAEVSGGSYARVALSANTLLGLVDLAGTQGAGTTTSSTGSSNQTSNNNTLTFASPTANWGIVAGLELRTQSSGGLLRAFGALTAPVTVNSGAGAPSISAAAMTLTLDN
ncbi:MAG: hypothetical protein KGL39_24640 [Patescibacteria group bacterium]|nr:hypothetical protein [Patescibacteria group bacterium]